MSFARRHLTFANVAAAIALLLATGGGALAATHYLITSTNQISPRVLSQLHGRRGPVGKTGKTGRRGKEGPRGKPGGPRGRRGPEGPAGPPGLVGVQGIQGLTGGKGPRGEPGAPGASAYSPLPPGQSESGVYAINAGSPAPEKLYEPVTLPILLGARVPAENVEYVPLKGKGPHCEAHGTAPRGYLCIYSDFPIEPVVLGEPIVVNPEAAESGPEGKGSGLHGFVLEWTPKPLDGAYDYGTYTVTEK